MKQLSEGQRYKIEAYLQAGIKKDEIAGLVGIHRITGTLYRSLLRRGINHGKRKNKYRDRRWKGAILTINDRKTGYLWTRLLPCREARHVTAAAIELLEPYRGYLHTITSDNGSEFAGHREIAEALNIEFYFARPYHSGERGANENTNGLIRQFISKGISMEDLSGYYLEEITQYINWRPRKRLGFLSPKEALVFSSLKKFLKYVEKWKGESRERSRT